MIIKVQLSLESNAPGHVPGSRMLVYNSDRSVLFETDAPAYVVEKMNGRPKAYFHAMPEGDTVVISEEAFGEDCKF